MKRHYLIGTAILATAISSTAVHANTWQGKANDAWLDGKIETALMLNGELNNFEIDTDVKSGKATLSGTVRTDIEKDLAGQIASNVEGVKKVDNQLEVAADYQSDLQKVGNNFATTWNDLTTTAGLNMKFATNDAIEATAIDVDTKQGVVTLTGTVKSEAAHDLAIEMAKGYDNVVEVEDKLVVSAQ